ncbi:MAG: M28 family peptidase [Gemmatimonadota bacterium]
MPRLAAPRVTCLTLAITTMASVAMAQTAASLKAAAATITPADVARRVGIIADDSMLGRDTPSRGLELTAAYVAAQFKKFGLKPGGEKGTWFQRYAIERKKTDLPGSKATFTAESENLSVDLTRDARYVYGGIPGHAVTAPTYLVGGPITVEAVKALDTKGKLVLVVLDYSKPLSTEIQQALNVLTGQKPTGMVLISNRDSAVFAQRVAGQGQERTGMQGDDEDTVPVIEVHERALGKLLAQAGVNPAEIRTATTLISRPLPALQISLDLREITLSAASAPNAIGILEGSDPVLRKEYIVYSAHMDHIGITPGKPDSINNGADDDGSGSTGVMELAEAYSTSGVRPKRSVIFMTVSGEEKGLWGSAYYTAHPTVPIGQIVADLNIDMIGRNWKDTIVAIGKEHSDLGATLNRVNAQHPELHMTAIDDRWPDENFYFRSDHFNFARRGVPILFFFNGVHADYHQVTDSPDKIDSEKESRILKLLFYLGEDIANAPARPKWNPDSYKQIVEVKP